MANNRLIFDRLVGLETEYAVAISDLPGHASEKRHANTTFPTKLEIYERVLVALSKRLPTIRASHAKEGAFLATGGAVWFEASRLADGGGLIEGATPECRRPKEVIAFQRAQDQLLEDAVAKSSFDCRIRLLKNDRDAKNNIYGAQENYDAEFARGVWLTLWRIGLILLFPLMVLTWLCGIALVIASLAYDYLASGVLVPLGDRLLPQQATARVLLGEDRASGRAFGAPWPAWLEGLSLGLERMVAAPLAGSLFLLLTLTGFRSVRRQLLPFLISRPIIAGAGMLDGDGRFLLADKSPAVNGILGYGGFFHGRPIILLGDFYKRMAHDALFAPQDYLDLFRPRQRLQIGIGDSNMCETAELLRVGTTMLVLDCIEAGELPEPPRLRRPIQALRAICADTELSHNMETVQGRCTALQLQRLYCAACRRFLSRRDEAPLEAWQILRLWEQTLDALENEPKSLIGKIDWITKKFLLEKAPHTSSWDSLKKIDLKYHELSPDGYHRILSEHLSIAPRIGDDEIERATRLPPFATPASLRGRLIREFLGGDEPLAVNWRMVRIGRGVASRVFRLSDHLPGYIERPSQDRHSTSPNVRPWADDIDGGSE